MNIKLRTHLHSNNDYQITQPDNNGHFFALFLFQMRQNTCNLIVVFLWYLFNNYNLFGKVIYFDSMEKTMNIFVRILAFGISINS